jgi:hypothetical protein
VSLAPIDWVMIGAGGGTALIVVSFAIALYRHRHAG